MTLENGTLSCASGISFFSTNPTPTLLPLQPARLYRRPIFLAAPEDDRDTSIHEKVNSVMLDLLSRIEVTDDVSRQSIETKLSWQRDYFFTVLDKDLIDEYLLNYQDMISYQYMREWWSLATKEQRQAIKLGLRDLVIEDYLNTYSNINYVGASNYIDALNQDDFSLDFFKVHRQAITLCCIELAVEAYFHTYPKTSNADALRYSISLNRENFTLELFLEELRIYKLEKNLQWFNWEEFKNLKTSPLQLLKTVLHHNKHPFPEEDFWKTLAKLTINTLSEPSLRSLDEAALLWNTLNTGHPFTNIRENGEGGTLSVDLLRASFLPALARSYQKQSIIDELFSSTNNYLNSKTDIYFDIAFRNAQNYSFDELINSPEAERIEEYHKLSQNEKRKILEKTFDQIGESVQYKIGSLAHSFASCLKRIYHYQHHQVAPPYRDEYQLISLFKNTEEQWTEKKNYPVHPRVLLAMHLAISNNISIKGANWKEKTKYLLDYLAQEFKKIITPEYIEQIKPSFDKRKAALEVLKEYELSDEQIMQERKYEILIPEKTPTGSHVWFVHSGEGNLIDEFLARANAAQTLPIDGGKLLDPGKELRKKEDQENEHFIHSLPQDPWIRYEATEFLKSQNLEVTPERLGLKTKILVDKYKIETKNVQDWANSVKSWVDVVPLIGPLKTFEQGIKDKNWNEILLGSVFFSLDAWWLMALSPVVIDGLKLAGSYISTGELMTTHSLRTFLRGFDFATVYIDQDPFQKISERNTFMTKAAFSNVQYETLAVLGKDGQRNQHQTIYLSDTREIVQVKNQGGYYRRVDGDGKPDLTKPLIYQGKKGSFFAAGLKGGAGDDFFLRRMSGDELEQRYSVKEAKQYLNDARDYQKHPHFPTLFKQHYTVMSEPPLSSMDKEFYEQVYQTAYENSPTFRRLFNRFKNKGGAWTIIIKAGQNNRTDLENKIIYLDPDIEKRGVRYLSNKSIVRVGKAKGEIFQKERAAFHEIIHSFVEEDDLASFEESIKSPKKNIVKAHRSGIVALTDMILGETGAKEFSPRLAYGLYEEDQHASLETLIDYVGQEDRHIDTYNAEIPLNEYTYIGGQKLSERYTVKATLDLLTEIKNINRGATIIDSFDDRFDSIFLIKNQALKQELYSFYSFLYDSSALFRTLFDHRFSKLMKSKLWILQTFSMDASEPISIGAYRMGDISNNVFENGQIRYLTDQGILHTHKQEQFLYIFLKIVLGPRKAVPLATQLKNKGPLVEIANRIFNEAGMTQIPKRLAEAPILPGDSFHKNMLLAESLNLARTGGYEERLITEQIGFFTGITCSHPNCTPCIPPHCRPSRKKRLVHQQKEMEIILRKIRDQRKQADVAVDNILLRNRPIKSHSASPSLGLFKSCLLVNVLIGVLSNSLLR